MLPEPTPKSRHIEAAFKKLEKLSEVPPYTVTEEDMRAALSDVYDAGCAAGTMEGLTSQEGADNTSLLVVASLTGFRISLNRIPGNPPKVRVTIGDSAAFRFTAEDLSVGKALLVALTKASEGRLTRQEHANVSKAILLVRGGAPQLTLVPPPSKP